MRDATQIITAPNDRCYKNQGRATAPSHRLNRDLLPLTFFCMLTLSFSASAMKAVPMVETNNYAFGISGYLRTGIGTSKGGKTQANFQAPGPQNKYSFGNQADTYGELEFDYTHYLNDDHSKWIDTVWMVSVYEPFDGDSSFNKTEQLYIKGNNLFDNDIDVWFGKRFYERQAIHLLDRQWNNAGQGGVGLGVEDLLNNDTDEDVKIALFQFQDDDITSFSNGETGNIQSYSLDTRWVHIPLSDTRKLNINASLSFRPEDEKLGYDAKYGAGLSIWQDYAKGYITDTTAIVIRQGADVPINHWDSGSEKENPGNDNIIRNDLDQAYCIELNNNFLYDDENWAFNGIILAQFRDYGEAPHAYGGPTAANLGDQLIWLSLGGRGMYYVNDQFRLALELTNDYISNDQEDISGSLRKITFCPEFALGKGFYTRPVLRPFITYASWDDDLIGFVGTGPGDSPYGDENSAVTAGIQFEIWW